MRKFRSDKKSNRKASTDIDWKFKNESQNLINITQLKQECPQKKRSISEYPYHENEGKFSKKL